MKIGIFGGSFNPPHNMHKTIALDLIKKSYLDKVIYTPTGDKYIKKDLIKAKDRLNMLKLMTKNYKNLEVSDYELKNILTPTYKTLDYFQEKYPTDEIYFICGSDNLKSLATWKNYLYILSNYKLLIIKRNNDDIKSITSLYPKENIIITSINKSNLSSTKIRENLNCQNIKVLQKQLDKNVLKYIHDKNLYQ